MSVVMTDIIDYEMMTVECFLSDLEVRNDHKEKLKSMLMTTLLLWISPCDVEVDDEVYLYEET